MREAIYFGLWAAACVIIAAAAFFGLLAYTVDGALFSGVSKFVLIAMPTGAVAGLGWFALHRGGRRPNWLGYTLLAVGTVFVSHILIASVLLFPMGQAKTSSIDYVVNVVLTILYHGWLTVPVALIGTALFVWARRKLAHQVIHRGR